MARRPSIATERVQKPRWRRDSKAHKELVRMFRSGEITKDMVSSDAFDASPLFEKYGEKTFTSWFRKVRSEGIEKGKGGDDTDNDDVNTKVSGPTGSRQMGNDDVEELDLSDDGDDADFYDSILKMSFMPIYELSSWSDFNPYDEKEDFVSLAVLLPAGVGYKMFSYRVAGDGWVFELCVDWPDEISDIDMMHRRWLKPNDGPPKKARNDPEITGFRHFRNMLVSNAGHAKVQSTAHIALPKKVETHLAMEANLGWKDSATKVLYVRMKAKKTGLQGGFTDFGED